MDKLQAFFQLKKIDESQRLVFGQIVAEVPDRSGEIMDYASSKPNFEAWSNSISKATGGKSAGNVRVMHGTTVAGKFEKIEFDDDAKEINGVAKIIDDAEWAKVASGCYSGFSIGGSYAKRWADDSDPNLIRYTANPSEVSLVDQPCVPTAVFTAVKADGSTELRKFATPVPATIETRDPTNEEIATKATELAKAAGDAGKWQDFIGAAVDELTKAAAPVAETPEPVDQKADGVDKTPDPVDPYAVRKAKTPAVSDITVKLHVDTSDAKAALDEIVKTAGALKDAIEGRAEKGADIAPETPSALTAPDSEDYGVVQKWHAKDGKAFDKKADAVAHNAEIEAKKNAAALAGPAEAALSALEAKFGKAAPEPEKVDDAAPAVLSFLTKALIDALGADAIAKYAGEEVWDSRAAIEALNTIFNLLSGERAEAEDKPEQVAALRAAIASLKDFIVSEIQENNDADAVMARAAGLMGDLAKRGARNSAKDSERIQSVHDHSCGLGAKCSKDNCGGDETEKAAGGELMKLAAENTALKSQMDALTKRVEELAAMPVPAPWAPGTRAVEKGEDSAPASDQSTLLERMWNDLTPEQRAREMFKLSHQSPRRSL